MKFPDDIYLKYDFFCGADRDVNIRLHTTKIIKTRKSHLCMIADLIGNEQHNIKRGERVRYDSAIVDGEWGGYYTCLECMDKYLIENVGLIPDK